MEIGLRREGVWKVSEGLTAASMKSGMLEVFATPAVVAFVEETAADCVAPFLREGQSTVGTVVNISHSAPTPAGAEVRCTVELTEVDRRRLVFRATVTDPFGVIASGVHERFVVDNDKFMEKVEEKRRSL